MKQTQHTPGNWNFDCYMETEYQSWVSFACSESGRKDYDFRVEFNREMPEEEQVANALLIGAAPALLAACKEALRYRRQTHHGDDECIALLEEAINMATP